MGVLVEDGIDFIQAEENPSGSLALKLGLQSLFCGLSSCALREQLGIHQLIDQSLEHPGLDVRVTFDGMLKEAVHADVKRIVAGWFELLELLDR